MKNNLTIQWTIQCVVHFFLYSVVLLFLLLGGQGITRDFSFKLEYIFLFLLQLIPSLLLYIIPIAIFYSYATQSFFLEKKGNAVWFDYLKKLKKLWLLSQSALILLLGFIYGWLLGWGIPYTEEFVYQKCKKNGIEKIQSIKPQVVYNLQNTLFISVDVREDKKIKDFFTNYFLPNQVDFLMYARFVDYFQGENTFALHDFYGSIQFDTSKIQMRVKKVRCDARLGINLMQEEKMTRHTLPYLYFSQNRNSRKELFKRGIAYIFYYIIPWIGWYQGRRLGYNNKSFVLLFSIGIGWLLVLYVLCQLLPIFF